VLAWCFFQNTPYFAGRRSKSPRLPDRQGRTIMYRGTIGSIEVACLGQFSHVLYNPATSLERVRHSWRKPPSHLQVNLQVSVGKWKAVCKVDHIIVILGNVRKRECEVPASRAGQYRNRTV